MIDDFGRKTIGPELASSRSNQLIWRFEPNVNRLMRERIGSLSERGDRDRTHSFGLLVV